MQRNIRLIYLHNFLTDFRFHFAFTIIYVAEITKSYTLAMGILALETLIAALMDIPAGALSDRFGRKYIIAIGSLCVGLSLACFAFATESSLLVVASVLSGLGTALFNGNNDALLFETLKQAGREKEFHHVQGRANSFFQMALGLSALLASIIAPHGLRYVFIAGIAPQLLGFIVSLFFIEPRVHIEQKEKSLSVLKNAWGNLWRNRKLRLLVVAQAISWGAGESQFQFQNTLFNTLWPTWALGVLRAIGHGLGFLGYWFSGWVIERVGAAKTMIIRGFYWLFSQALGLLFLSGITPLMFASGALLWGPGQVASSKIQQEEFSDAQRATMGSIASFVGSILYALCALILGITADHFGLVAAVALAIIMTAASLPFYIWLHIEIKKSHV